MGERNGPNPGLAGSELREKTGLNPGWAGSEVEERNRPNPGSAGSEKGTGRTLVRQVQSSEKRQD